MILESEDYSQISKRVITKINSEIKDKFMFDLKKNYNEMREKIISDLKIDFKNLVEDVNNKVKVTLEYKKNYDSNVELNNRLNLVEEELKSIRKFLFEERED